MIVTVRLFARAKDLAGTDAVMVEVPAGANIQELRRRLAEIRPELTSMVQRSVLAVNREFADNAVVLQTGDEIALLPPVSGGQSFP